MEVSGCFHLSSWLTVTAQCSADCWLAPTLATDDTDTAITACTHQPPLTGCALASWLRGSSWVKPGKEAAVTLIRSLETRNVRQCWDIICNVHWTSFRINYILLSDTTFHHCIVLDVTWVMTSSLNTGTGTTMFSKVPLNPPIYVNVV